MIKNTVEDVFSVGTWSTPLCFSLELISFLNKIPTRKREELPVSPPRISCGLPHNFSLKSLQNQKPSFFLWLISEVGLNPMAMNMMMASWIGNNMKQWIVAVFGVCFSSGVGSDCTIYIILLLRWLFNMLQSFSGHEKNESAQSVSISFLNRVWYV